MENKAKIRVNLNTREVELEGTEAFIEKYSEIINSYLDIIKVPVVSSQPASLAKPYTTAEVIPYQTVDVKIDSSSNALPDSFGEYYSRFPKTIKDVDKILAAGYFCQMKNGSSFSTQEASALLIEQNIKLTNPAASMGANLSMRKIFKHEGKYRISEMGVDFLKKLVNAE